MRQKSRWIGLSFGGAFLLVLASLLCLTLAWSLPGVAAASDNSGAHRKHHRHHRRHHRKHRHHRRRLHGAQAGAAAPAAVGLLAGVDSKAPLASQEIEPYSPHPSETLPYEVCPPPTKARASCLAVGAPNPEKLEALDLPAPSYEGSGKEGGYSPADLQSAYKLPKEGGEGMTVAIAVAWDDPKAESDLATYRETYGLPKCSKENGCLSKVNQKGEEANYPEAESHWALETSLDLDMVSAACPKCHILLVEADSEYLEDLGPAVEKAAEMGANVITDSWGILDYPYGSSYNHYFKHPGIPVLFASGDYSYGFSEGGFGQGVDYPSASPDVVAVGGTSLKKAENSRGWTESAWSGAGSGCSEYEEKPLWQLDEICPKRTTADVSAVADPYTPVSVYDSFEKPSNWWLVGGTSASTPLTAGIEALSSKYARSLPGGDLFYADQGELFDVTSGSNDWAEICAAPAENPAGRDYLCNAKAGYDGPTGNGTPNGPFEVTSLPPLAVSKPPTAVSASAATLHGAIDPQGASTTYRFEYGTTTSYGTNAPVPDASAGSGTAASEVSREISGLAANTTYHYRLTATNATGTSHGEDRTFRTAAPTVTAVSPSSGPASGGTTVTITGTNFVGVSAVKFGADSAESFEVKSESSISAVAPSPTQGLGTVDVTVTTAAGTSATGSADRFTDKLVGPGRSWGAGDYGELGNRLSELINTPTEIIGLPRSKAMASGSYSSTALTATGTVMAWGEDWIGQLGAGKHKSEGGSEYVSFVPIEVCAVGATECKNGPYLEEVTSIASTGVFTLALLKDGTVVGWGQNYDGQLGSGNRAECHTGGWVCSRTPVHVCTVMESPCAPEHYLRGVTAIAAGYAHSLALLEDGTVMAWGENTYGQLGNGSFTGPEMCGGLYACSQVPEPVAGLSNVTAIAAGLDTSYAALKNGTMKAWGENKYGSLGDGTLTNRDVPVSVCAAGEKAPCANVLSGVTDIAGNWAAGYALLEGGKVMAWGNNWEGELGTGSLPHEGCECSSTPVEVTAIGGVVDIAAGGSSASALLKDGRMMSWGGDRNGQLGNGKNEANPTPTRVCAAYAAAPCPSGPYLDEEGVTAAAAGFHALANVSSTPEWERRSSPNVEGATESRLEATSCASSASCEAVGLDTNPAGTDVTLAEHWNGSAWSIQSTPNPGGAKSSILEGVSCASTTSCEATGRYENGLGAQLTLAEHWNGSEWALQSTPALEGGAKEAKLTGVSCVTTVSCTAVGSYKNISGIHVTLAEHWNGTSWEIQSIPNPEETQNSFLFGVSCTSATACEASGYYVKTSGGAKLLAERWNGTKWEVQLPPNPEGMQNGYLFGTSCTSASACTAAGYYYNSSGTIVGIAERWNGTKWETQSTVNPEGAKATHLVGISCTSATACAASGSYTNGSGVEVPLAEAWNGTKWEAQSVPSPEGAKEALLTGGVSCTSASACTGTGFYKNSSGTVLTLAERWNGTKWEAQSTPNRDGTGQSYFDGEPSCASATACEVVGVYTNGTGEHPLAARWNGLEWTIQWTPSPAGAKEASLTSTSCPSATECAAVGHYKNSSGTTVTLAERLSGGEWSVQSTPNPEGATESWLTAVSCSSTSACTATGYYKNGSGTWLPLAERWNGTTWSLQTMANPTGAKETKPEGVSCPSSTSCKATGYYQNSSGVHVSLAESWNGTSWEVQSTPNPEGAKDTRLFAVSCASSEACRSSGYYENSAGERIAFTEAWTPSTWSLQSPPLPSGAKESKLYGMSCPTATSCRATGWYHGSSGENVPLAEHWNGTSWALETALAPGGSKNAYLGGVSCPSAEVCVGTGYWVNGSGTAQTMAETLGSFPPVVATRSATAIAETGATLNGAVNPNGAGTEYFFEYGPTTSYGSKTAVGYASGTNTSERSETIGGLEVGQTYHFRIVAVSAAGTTQGEDQTFTTTFKPPKATTEAATALKTTRATLNATVNPDGGATSYYFEYGTTTSYGSKVPTGAKEIGSGTSGVAVSQTPTGLSESTTYHFRVVAENEAGVTNGADKTFTTPSATGEPLSWMAVTDPFNGSTSAISNFSSNWSALGWANGSPAMGEDTASGWKPTKYSTVAGAYFAPTVSDVGTGVADSATMATNPCTGLTAGYYFALWLDMTTPASTRNGYELRFTCTPKSGLSSYEVKLSKWVGGTQTVLTSKSAYAFVNGNSLALADQGGTVSAWTDTGSGFTQLLSASDSAFEGGNAGLEGSGIGSHLTNFKVGQLLAPVEGMNTAIEALPVNDAFSGSESPLSYGGAFAALAWDNSTSGQNTGRVSGGWGPYDAYSTINGAYWQKTSFADTGAGDATAATLTTSPASTSRYFSLWLNMLSPGSAHSGYQLKFTETSSGVYTVTLAKWISGTETVLATKTSYSFATKSQFALVDKLGTVSAWTKTGSEYTQLLSASDSTYTSGYTGVEGSGNITRLTSFKSGPLAPF
jgi:alpha-tubulin suppressor-like RCC1 family protein